MKVNLEPGKYVIAVSGGVDSVVLLDVLSKQSDLELIVAHFDHGIRADSKKDAEFVKKLAADYGLAFELGSGNLGPDASEEKARNSRYEFLRKVQRKHQADAMVTAHHLDDMMETATINLLRGTGRKGLSALKSRPDVKRPLLNQEKGDIIAYAKRHRLQWREDPTNSDQRYLRNYVRHSVLPKLSDKKKSQLLRTIESSAKTGKKIEELLDELLDISIDHDQISRDWVVSLPHAVTKELLAHWLRKYAIEFDSATIERLSVGIKTTRPGKRLDIRGRHYFTIDKNAIRLLKS